MIDVTKIVREITYNGTKIPLLGTGDNIIKVLTEAELNALLVPENVDKLVAYNGELYVIAEDASSTNTPIAVGDTIDKLYFNTSKDFDLSGFTSWVDYEEDENGNIVYAQANFLTADEGHTVLNYIVDLREYAGLEGEGTVASLALSIAGDTDGHPVWASDTFEIDGVTFTKGWSMDNFAFGKTVESVAEQQDIWGNFISKEPFGGTIIAKPIAGKLLSVDSNGDIVSEIITYAEEASF